MNIIDEILEEVENATRKFPSWPTDPLHAFGIVSEEYSELSKAVLQNVYEPHKTGINEIRTEAIQTAAMAIRFLMSLDNYEFVPSTQHNQEPLGENSNECLLVVDSVGSWSGEKENKVCVMGKVSGYENMNKLVKGLKLYSAKTGGLT